MKRKYKILLFFILNAVMTLLIPFFAVKLVPSDAGMAVCMLLFFVVYPILFMLVGFVISRDMKYLWWMPFFSFIIFPLLFSAAMGGIVEELYAYSMIYLFLSYAVSALLLIIKKIALERKMNDKG